MTGRVALLGLLAGLVSGCSDHDGERPPGGAPTPSQVLNRGTPADHELDILARKYLPKDPGADVVEACTLSVSVLDEARSGATRTETMPHARSDAA